MSKKIKDQITQIYNESYSDLIDACVVDVTRMSVKAVTAFRASMRKQNVRVQVVKNSLARRAFKGTPLEPLGDSLSGPCALVTGGDSIIELAKRLLEARKEFAALELKQAIVEGDATLLTIEQLSKMKGRLELIGEVAMLVSSPGRAISGCMKGAGGRIAGCLKTLADKTE